MLSEKLLFLIIIFEVILCWMRTGALVSSSAQTSHFLIRIWGLLKNECVDYASPPPRLSPSCCSLHAVTATKMQNCFLTYFYYFFCLRELSHLPSQLPERSEQYAFGEVPSCVQVGLWNRGTAGAALPPSNDGNEPSSPNFYGSSVPPFAERSEIIRIGEGRKVGMGNEWKKTSVCSW